MRLGKLEKAILLAALKRREKYPLGDSKYPDPDLYRDELPQMLWQWRPIRKARYSQRRSKFSDPIIYDHSRDDYNAKQASLTRALQTLYAKKLIDCDDSYGLRPHAIYSEIQAAKLGVEPTKTNRERYTDAELDRVRICQITGQLFTLRKKLKNTMDKKESRNIKSFRLTDEGLLVAQNKALPKR